MNCPTRRGLEIAVVCAALVWARPTRAGPPASIVGRPSLIAPLPGLARAPARFEPYLDLDAGLDLVRAEANLLGPLLLGEGRTSERPPGRDRLLYSVAPRVKVGLAKMIVRVGGGVLFSLTPQVRIGIGLAFARPAAYPMAAQIVVPLQFRF